jgi:Tfp pilus assembly protein PilX
MHVGLRTQKVFKIGLFLMAMAALALTLCTCAGHQKTTLRERLTAMSDEDLIAFYQGIDARLRSVGEGVRRETADKAESRSAVGFQQAYFVGGDGHRLLKQRAAAEKELLRRAIPRSRWTPRPD